MARTELAIGEASAVWIFTTLQLATFLTTYHATYFAERDNLAVRRRRMNS
jgi:hypothetical protein